MVGRRDDADQRSAGARPHRPRGGHRPCVRRGPRAGCRGRRLDHRRPAGRHQRVAAAAAGARPADLGGARPGAAPRGAAGQGADRGRRRLRHGGRVHLLAAARGLRLPFRQRALVRPSGPRPRLPRGPGARAYAPGAPVLATAGRRHRRSRGRLGGPRPARRAHRRPGGLLVRVPGRLPGQGQGAAPLRRGLRRRLVPRAARHRPGDLGVAAAGSDRPGPDRQPAERGRRWLRLVRPGGRHRRAGTARPLVPAATAVRLPR